MKKVEVVIETIKDYGDINTNLVGIYDSLEKAKAAMDKVQQAFANGSLAPTQIVAIMRAMVAANQSRLAVPVGVAAGSAAPMPMAQTIINMNNTFNTHDSLSEAELTDETEAMAERLPWKIP